MSLEKAGKKIVQLEDAVKRIDSIRKHLIQNASDICKDVKGSINRGIECLHNREANLLEEVNQVCLMKEESLQLQQGRLKQAINILCSAVTLVKDNPSSEIHLGDTLERLSQLELSPEETPYIGFRADQLGLMERCLSHGRVDAHGLPLPHAFQDPSVPSACLPRSLEEYDDCQHHIFTKTLKEIKKNPDTTASVKVNINIPKLSHKTEDWLAWRGPGATAAPRPATLVAPPCRPTPATLTPHAPASPSPAGGKACSLNSWLVQIKQHADLEEEHNFEIVDNASVMSGINTDEKPQLELNKWLNQSANKSNCESVPEDFFSHINKDLGAWLSTVRGQLASISSTSVSRGADMFQHIPREGWLRSRAAVRHSPKLHADNADFFSHIPKEPSVWLKQQQPAEQQLQQVQTSVPTINTAVSKSKDDNKWLLNTPTKERKRTNLTNKELFSPWLVSPKISREEAEQESQTPSLPPSNYSSWSTMSQLSSQTSGSKGSQSHSSLVWLEQKLSDISVHQTQPEVISNSNSDCWLIESNPAKKRHIETGKSSSADQLCDWLMVPQHPKEEPSPAVDDEVEDQDEMEAVEAASHATSDSWSVVSTPHSVGSDQHQRDVAAADDYYRRWLL